jgi:hypothetical protein
MRIQFSCDFFVLRQTYRRVMLRNDEFASAGFALAALAAVQSLRFLTADFADGTDGEADSRLSLFSAHFPAPR